MTTSFPPPTAGLQPNARLNGWKEIASYFGRGVRTVQRWEKVFGMPVHRIGTGRGENVHAFSEELDGWLKTVELTRDLSETPGDADRNDASPSSGADGGAFPDSPAGQEPASPIVPVPATPDRRLRIAAFVVVSVVLMALAGLFVWQRMPVAQPSSAKFDVDTLHVFDADRRLLWSKKFDLPVPAGYFDVPPVGVGSTRVVIDDLDGDGSREVVLFATSGHQQWADRVVAYNARGDLRYSHSPAQSVRFGDITYAPPWSGHWLFVTNTGGKRQLWATWVHVKSGNFPCLLERLSPDGHGETEYWSAGYVDLVHAAAVGGVASIFVGAANNDHKGASLAVFDADKVKGSAPAETADKTCRTCPPGSPRAFLVFPRMEFLERAGWVATVVGLREQANGELRVSVAQGGLDHDSRAFGVNVFYDLLPDLTPAHAEISSAYEAWHRRLEATGDMDHPFGDRERAQAWPVLVWNQAAKTFVPVTGTIDK